MRGKKEAVAAAQKFGIIVVCGPCWVRIPPHVSTGICISVLPKRRVGIRPAALAVGIR